MLSNKRMCDGFCKGTGEVTVDCMSSDSVLLMLWATRQHEDGPSEDGTHVVPCPKCFGIGFLYFKDNVKQKRLG